MDEFSLIQKYFKRSKTGAGVTLGIGDDTAIIETDANEELLVTTDTLISGIHFPELTSPEAIAYKALAVNLSDIAAMGGTPRWYTLALTLPSADSEWLNAFAASLHRLADSASVCLLGGDTTRGKLSITITLLGTVPKGRAIRRSGAQPGDQIMVTGSPGLASLGLACLQGQLELSPNDRKACLKKLEYPEPRLAEGEYLRDYATAMIDVSDGVSADLSHILELSGVGAILDQDALLMPIDKTINSGNKEELLDAVIYGGDDYELLFTVAAGRLADLQSRWPKNFAPVHRVGEITTENGMVLKRNDAGSSIIKPRGYKHFL